METIFLYLTKRNKRGMRLLCHAGKGKCHPTRLTDLNRLGIEHKTTAVIQNIVENSKMQWEPWIESAASIKELLDKLRKRGYRNLPTATRMEVDTPHNTISEHAIKQLPNQKTMTRRGN